MAQFRTHRLFDVIFVLIVGAGVAWAAINRTAIQDWYFFTHYAPIANVVGLADDSGLNTTGRRLLYRTDPQITDKATINQVCGAADLGCLTPAGQAFILDEPDKHDRTVVTAAHEMLHLAYRRLSQAQKDELKPLLDQAIAQHGADGLNDELNGTGDADDRYDEAHSLLGSEYADLPPALEVHYQVYFSDRAKVVAAAKSSLRASR